jgi:hypothetical protein
MEPLASTENQLSPEQVTQVMAGGEGRLPHSFRP